MTISAFVLAALMSVAFFTVRASQRVDRQTRLTENVSRLMAALARDIEQIAPVHWAGPAAGFVFQATDQRLMFARQTMAPDGAPDDQTVILESKGGQLYRSEAPLLPTSRAATDIAAGMPQAMLDMPVIVRFAYFSRLASGQEALTDTWSDPTQLPVAIRVSITDPQGRVVGNTRVQLRVDAEPGCAVPDKATCSLATATPSDDDAQAAAPAPIDVDDPLGWERYAK